MIPPTHFGFHGRPYWLREVLEDRRIVLECLTGCGFHHFRLVLGYELRDPGSEDSHLRSVFLSPRAESGDLLQNEEAIIGALVSRVKQRRKTSFVSGLGERRSDHDVGCLLGISQCYHRLFHHLEVVTSPF